MKTKFSFKNSKIFETPKYGIYATLGNLVLALSLVGYPLSASITNIFFLGSSEFNQLFRLVVLVISCIVFFISLNKEKMSFNFAVIAFLLIYTARLLYDFLFSDFANVDKDFPFFIASTLLPTFAIGMRSGWYNERLCLKLIASIGGIAAILIAYNLIYRPDDNLREILGGRSALESLNPIAVSYHGLYILSAAFILMIEKVGGIKRIFWSIIVILGGYLFVAGGSRGPIVALLIAIFVTTLASTRNARIQVISVFTAVLTIFIFGAPELILERFLIAGSDASSLERVDVASLAIETAVAYPVLGYGYVEPVTGYYPHNLVIEAALALGITGAFLMLWIQVAMIRASWILAQNGEKLLPFLGLIALSNAWISGSIWGAGSFFAIVWIMQNRISALGSSTPYKRIVLQSNHSQNTVVRVT